MRQYVPWACGKGVGGGGLNSSPWVVNLQADCLPTLNTCTSIGHHFHVWLLVSMAWHVHPEHFMSP